jgi:hypothetical protein
MGMLSKLSIPGYLRIFSLTRNVEDVTKRGVYHIERLHPVVCRSDVLLHFCHLRASSVVVHPSSLHCNSTVHYFKLTRKIEQSVRIQMRFPRDTINPHIVIHEKVEENREKERKTHTLPHLKKYALIFYTFTVFYLFNFNKTTFYKKNSSFNTLLVILI